MFDHVRIVRLGRTPRVQGANMLGRSEVLESVKTVIVQLNPYFNTLIAFGRYFKCKLQRELVELLVEFWVPSIVKLGCDRRN